MLPLLCLGFSCASVHVIIANYYLTQRHNHWTVSSKNKTN